MMRLHPRITEERILDACERRMTSLDDPGFCLACGLEQGGCEPDARRYRCEALWRAPGVRRGGTGDRDDAVIWVTLEPHVDLGFLPGLISEDDPRPVREQLADTYRHGGGWDPMAGWRLGEDHSLHFPHDPPMKPLAMTRLRHETLLFYPHAFLCVLQPDGSFEVSRVD